MQQPDPSAGTPSDLREALAAAASRYPDRGIAIFDRRGRNAERRTYGEVYAAALQQAARFAALGVEEREPVLVALPTSWAWMDCWMGLMLRGALPVALSAGGPMGAAKAQVEKVELILAMLGAKHVIGTEAFLRQTRRAESERLEGAVWTPEEIAGAAPSASFRPHAAEPEETAFLQLTSGSTGVPRAVMISHRAALHNPQVSDEAIGAPYGEPISGLCESMVSWLPLYHDMGLIGCLMLPILTGLDLWLLRPDTFLARPQLWLEHLGKHGPSFAPAPNFAYQLCCERVEPDQIAGIDLSGWRRALSGAEMVRPETTAAFSEKFAPQGFSPRAFLPCYGLAESTLAVTFDTRGDGVRTLTRSSTGESQELRDFVSLGLPVRDMRLRIVAGDGAELPQGSIGEVLVAGPSIFNGYYDNPAATAEALRDGWLATGDLGFLHQDELYITGRIKDVLIIRGHNLMPDDLERVAEGVTGGGGRNRCGAFSVDTGSEGEGAVLTIETEEQDPEVRARIDHEVRVQIGRTLSLPLADLLFVRRGRIPRTSSGKVQRNELRRLYLAGALDRLGS